ncbi:MAG: hypothetical protein EXS08_11420 [Planctomycetes bacterium]|nr:hypothetical protein [Planctomycetota bacterium]
MAQRIGGVGVLVGRGGAPFALGRGFARLAAQRPHARSLRQQGAHRIVESGRDRQRLRGALALGGEVRAQRALHRAVGPQHRALQRVELHLQQVDLVAQAFELALAADVVAVGRLGRRQHQAERARGIVVQAFLEALQDLQRAARAGQRVAQGGHLALAQEDGHDEQRSERTGDGGLEAQHGQ